MAKQYETSTVQALTPINGDIFRLDCGWTGSSPRLGQFFMLKPQKSRVFLPRPISAAFWDGASGVLSFLILRRGKGTQELGALQPGETIELFGPLGNSWEDFLAPRDSGKPDGIFALVGGGIGIAPLLSLPSQYPGHFDFYAGFRADFDTKSEQENLFGAVTPHVRKLVLAFEQRRDSPPLRDTNEKICVCQGRIPDFLNPADYQAVFACGPEAMLKAVAEQCATAGAAAGVPCYVSLERRMACGVGACLGCTVPTARGNRRCCADGPIFPAF